MMMVPVGTAPGEPKEFVLPIGVVTLLLGDVEGSVRLWESDPVAARESLIRLQGLITDVVASQGGVRPEEQGEGDSFVAAFARPTDALRAAVDLQLALSPDQWPDAPQLRIAVHTGEVELRDQRNYIGETIHRTARLRNTGHGGQTLLSSTTRELVGDRLPPDISLTDLGTHRLRDLGRPEHVWQLSHPKLRSEFPSLRSLDAQPHNLPTLLTPFVGRSRELAEVGGALAQTHLLTIVGPGGAGKTRLALQATADALESLPGGAWFVDLSSIVEGGLVLERVAAALSLGDVPPEQLMAAIAARDGALMVLDNCEHVIDSAAEAAEFLLCHAPSLRILATSREPLGIPGEVTWRIPPLSLPSLGDGDGVGALAASEAIQFFVAAAKRARPSFVLDEGTARVVAAICARLDGIPLALELAASLVRVQTVDEIAAGLDDRFRLLGAGPRTVMPRQQTLRASIDWSYQLLDDEERLLLQRLSVFAGPVDLSTIEAVVGYAPLEKHRVFDGLSRLVDKSLVVSEDGGPITRFRLLDTIRHFATERLAERPADDEALRLRHLACLAETARSIEAAMIAGAGADLEKALSKAGPLTTEIDAALRWAESTERWWEALDLAASASLLWARRPATSKRVFTHLLGSGAEYPVDLRLRGLRAATHSAGRHYRHHREMAEAFLATAQEAGDRRARLEAMTELGQAMFASGKPDEGQRLLDEVIADAQPGDEPLVWAARYWLAGEAFQSGRPADCRSTLLEILPETRELHPPAIPEVLAIIGICELVLGNPRRMRELLDEAWEYGVAAEDPDVESAVLMRYQALELAVGNIAECKRRCEEQLALSSVAYPALASRIHLTWCALAEHDMLAAQHHLSVGLKEAETRADEDGLAGLRVIESEILRQTGSVRAALKSLEAIDSGRGRGASPSRRRASVVLARVLHQEGRLADAEDVAQDALSRHAESGAIAGLPDVLEELAALAAASDDDVRAARLYGAAAGIRERTGLARSVYVPEHAAEAEAFMQRASEELLEAVEEGRRMSPPEAIAYARRGRGERNRPNAGWSALTPTELEVVRLVAEHLNNPQIAERLFMSRNTVKTHLSHIFDKLGIATRSELASEAARRGIT